MVAEHEQATTRHYTMHYPAHPARKDDPHYKDFDAYRRRTKSTAVCEFADRSGRPGECSGGLELHHSHIEFSLQNGVDLSTLERDYPGVSSPDEVGSWVESGANLQWLCEFHHRGHGGVHTASASDYEASVYVTGLIT
jgi:hypothetical protein